MKYLLISLVLLLPSCVTRRIDNVKCVHVTVKDVEYISKAYIHFGVTHIEYIDGIQSDVFDNCTIQYRE